MLRQVALHPEGVDRNVGRQAHAVGVVTVALHPEGVDRNVLTEYCAIYQVGRPPPGGRG